MCKNRVCNVFLFNRAPDVNVERAYESASSLPCSHKIKKITNFSYSRVFLGGKNVKISIINKHLSPAERVKNDNQNKLNSY